MALFVAGQKIRASQLNVGLGTYSLFTGTTTATPIAWTPIPFATLAQGNAIGLTIGTAGGVANSSFTLAAGCWLVQFGGIVDAGAGHPSVTGTFFALANTAGVPTASAYAMSEFGVQQGQSGGTITAQIESDGTFVVIPHIFCSGQASALTNTNGLAPRLSFKQVND